MTIQSAQDLFFYDLCGMYDAELKLAQVLPTLAQESQDAQTRDAFLEHQQETVHHAQNLEQCFQILGRSPVKLENHAVAGLKEDHEKEQVYDGIRNALRQTGTVFFSRKH
jgi:ferritin-like metal-binding protein YciE